MQIDDSSNADLASMLGWVRLGLSLGAVECHSYCKKKNESHSLTFTPTDALKILVSWRILAGAHLRQQQISLNLYS